MFLKAMDGFEGIIILVMGISSVIMVWSGPGFVITKNPGFYWCNMGDQLIKMLKKICNFPYWLFEKSVDDSVPFWAAGIYMLLFVLCVAIITYISVFIGFLLLFPCEYIWKKLKELGKWFMNKGKSIKGHTFSLTEELYVVMKMKIEVKVKMK